MSENPNRIDRLLRAPAKMYPKATASRRHHSDAEKKETAKSFFMAAGKNLLILQLVFLGLFSYIFGSLFLQGQKIHHMKIAFVDYDNGSIGTAIRTAYRELESESFPTLMEYSNANFASPADLREAVCDTRYWAALYVSPGASDRLSQVLEGDSPASLYERNASVSYIWNQARYPVTVDSAISVNLQKLSSAAGNAYGASTSLNIVRSLPDPDAVSVFTNPWTLNDINIQPTTQGSRAIYNTVAIILILMQEFFYLGVINGLSIQLKIYTKFSPWKSIIIRNTNSLLYTFIGSLCTTGAIWAFRSGWDVNANQFVLSWMAIWLFAHLNFLTLDVFTVWLPVPYVPISLVTWIIFNITSVIVPFDVAPDFYRIGYAAPAHEVFQVLIDIWSGGCNPHLEYALPILFAWEIFGLVVSGLGIFRRCHYAMLAEEKLVEVLEKPVEEGVLGGTGSPRNEDEQDNVEESRVDLEQSATISPTSTAHPTQTVGRSITRTNTLVGGASLWNEDDRRSSIGNLGPAFSVLFSPDTRSD